jgi:hypothetical protein
VAWHLKSGPDLETWLTYSDRQRKLILEEVERRIEVHNSLFDQ